MKNAEEGLLRYDRMDTESWCFDMGYQIIPIHSGMKISILDNRFRTGELLETPDGELTVIFGNGKARYEYKLDQGTRYPAKMPATTVEETLDQARLTDLNRNLDKKSDPGEEDSDDLCF